MATLGMIDRLDTLSAREELGVLREVTRRARVINLTSTDYRVLQESLTAAGIPAYGTPLSGAGFEQLVLVERSPQIVEQDKIVDVDLRYKHIMDGSFQNLYQPTSGFLYGKMRSSVQEKKTNFYTDPLTGKRIQIVVRHTYPPDDTLLGKQTFTEGGEISVQVAQDTYHLTGYINTSKPWIWRRRFMSAVNATTWLGYPQLTWMCTAVEYEMMVQSNNVPLNNAGRYRFDFEFQYNSDGWMPTAVFNDSRTGRPPPNLVAGIGYQVVPYYKLVNFTGEFRAFNEGWFNFT